MPVLNPWEYAFLNSPTYKTPCPNKNYSLRAGILGDYVWNRRLEIKDFPQADILQTSLSTYQGVLTFNLCKRFELYVGLGSSQLNLLTPASAFGYQFTGTLQSLGIAPPFGSNNYPIFDPNGLLSIASTAAFSCNLGLSGILWTCNNLALSVSGHYFYTNPPIANVTLPPTFQNNAVGSQFIPIFGGDTPTAAPSTIYLPNSSFKYQEWQTDLCLAYTVCISRTLKAIPFVAFEWAGVLVDFGNALISTLPTTPTTIGVYAPQWPESAFTANLYPLQEQNPFGFTVGTSFVGRDRFAAGIEWRFINESAFCVDVNMSF
ncbi:MAG: hypothetical protein JSS62_05460 [Verrucomicrobia bacterium]|nr:hypothetical protein [Verrucomicrobiota bacterium]